MVSMVNGLDKEGCHASRFLVVPESGIHDEVLLLVFLGIADHGLRAQIASQLLEGFQRSQRQGPSF